MVILVAVTFILCLGIVLGTYWVFVVGAEKRAADALRRRLDQRPAETPHHPELMKQHAPLSTVKVLDGILEHSGALVAPLKATVANSGLQLTAGAVLLGGGLVALIAFFVFTVVMPAWWMAALIAIAAAFVPYGYVRYAAAQRLQKLEQQLPQAIDMISVSLRAGHAFTTGLLMVADDLPNPLGGEFRVLYDQQNFGKPLPDILREFAGRVPLLDARIFVTAVLTQRETGGNLAEVLDKLSAVTRQRFRVRREVKAMSAHGRITGWVLGAMPAVLAGVLYIVAPTHIMTMVNDPLGHKLIAGAVVLQIIGTIAIRRIVDIEF
jgi:tight adherence protein B